MDKAKGVSSSIEGMFSKVHPCFHPQKTRIAIVGAGPSGLSAAYALCRLGYTNVTVLEKNRFPGGMCESAEIQGKIYDLGGQVVAANSAPTILQLATDVKVELEEMDSHKFAVIDSSTGAWNEMNVVDDYVAMIPLTVKLQDKANNSGRIGLHAMSDLASELTPAFLKDHGFKSVPSSVECGYTASGYGFVEDMPYAYLHEFIRTSMAGKIRRFRGGYMSIWSTVAKNLPITVHYRTEVVSVKRELSCVKVDVKKDNCQIQAMEFDKIIISGSFPINRGRVYRTPSSQIDEATNEVMDFSPLEKELFSKVHYIDYYTSVFKIKGFKHIPMGFYYFKEFMNPTAIGNPVAMQKFYDDTDIFLFWSYGDADSITEENVIKLAVNTVEKMGGEVQEMVLQRRFKYFPHVRSQDIKDGFYDKVEFELQGHRNTFFVGGLMAFELTERNSNYAMALMCKHFGNRSSFPDFPYIKRLLPLKSSRSDRHLQLEEFSEVHFPDLPCLDAYLKHWATHEDTQNKTIYTWINEKGDPVAKRTYRELDNNASCIAYKLLTTKKPKILPGDRVLLVYIPGLEFIDAFFGCLRAGVIPVPVIPPDLSQKSGQSLLHITNIAKTCNPVVILSTVGYHLMVRATSAKNMLLMTGKGTVSLCWPDLPWLHTDKWIKTLEGANYVSRTQKFQPSPDDLCFLQFTSGSTSDAKGVMITHGGIIHNVKLMKRRYNSTSNTVLVSWLPQYHDMGLIGGLLTAMVSGASAFMFSPVEFIKNPLLWLDTMSNYRATHSAAPNFAFELLVRRLEKNKKQNLDLSSMIFLMSAAEPIRNTAMKRFIELTEPFGLSEEVIAPGYGLAENCVYVCSAYGEGQPIFVDWEGRVCCGYQSTEDGNDVQISIVDPETGIERENSAIEGEIWISSESAAIGYWGMKELSQTTFCNELQKHPGKRYIRTGDLGRIIDGKIFVTGRIKDLIIVAGKNIYPSDVEKTVENSSEVIRPGCCAVVCVKEEILLSKGISVHALYDNGGLVVIAEVREDKPIPETIIHHIRACVVEEHGVNISYVALIKARTISKTSSGKIKRFDCARRFIEGTLPLVNKPADREKPSIQKVISSNNATISKEDIISFLKEIVEEQTGSLASSISASESLTSYGIDSIGVVRAAQKLSDFLGVQVSAIDIFSATCIEDLANFSENLLAKSRPQVLANFAGPTESKEPSTVLHLNVSISHKLVIWSFQVIGLLYISFLLILPAYLSIRAFTPITSDGNQNPKSDLFMNYLLSLACAPLSWMLCIFSTCITIAIFGNLFLQPNYALQPVISIWSVAFVKWWTLYKVQEVSSKVLATHLRGTVFINYWFKMLGANIASSAILDTVDITDPALVSIGNEAVIAEGSLIQSHEVKNGIISFSTVKIGQKSCIGPYAVIQMRSVNASGVVGTEYKVTSTNSAQRVEVLQQNTNESVGIRKVLFQFFGIYMVGFLGSLAAASTYCIYIFTLQKESSLEHFGFVCIAGAFHWLPSTIFAYVALFPTAPSNPINFSSLVTTGYLIHGFILCFLTCCFNHFLSYKGKAKNSLLQRWLLNRVNIACHIKIVKFLSGTEAFCVYLRSLGAKVGRHSSIRAINPISAPESISIGDGVHLGDVSRIVPGYYGSTGYNFGKIEIGDNSVIGSQCLLLPGSVIENDVVMGALSIAPMNSIMKRGGVYVGSEAPVMVRNTICSLDDRTEEMDIKYKKVLGNLAANLAASTLKLSARYFHRIGVGGRGTLNIFNHISNFPDHAIFSTGKIYPIILRHSNCLSSDDDARVDPRGAAIRILSNETDQQHPLLDLTLMTGKAFHGRTIGDIAMWHASGVAAREEFVKHAPHIRDAIWGSLRRADSYTELHYYSNTCRLLRFKDGREMFVKFKLRPSDENIDEDSGMVHPRGILPPETGSIPRDENDTRPLLFLAKDFQDRVNSDEKVRYILQLQAQPVPEDESMREIVLDSTRPWDETEFPHHDIGEIIIDQVLTEEEQETLEFNPFLRCQEVDVIRATSCNQSASIDHGRSIVYAICQHMRNRKPLPEHWRSILDQSDVKVNLSGCPMAAALEGNSSREVTLTRPWYLTLWLITAQPFLQLFTPYFLMGLVIFAPLKWTYSLHKQMKIEIYWLMPFFWMVSGILAGVICSVSKWILVGKRKEGETEKIWSKGPFLDTIWQAIRTMVADYFMGMTSGSFIYGIWMKLMGSDVAWSEGVYVDSDGAILNPEMVKVEEYGSVGREALLFGHIYDGEGGNVKYGKILIGKGGYVGSRAVAMPGVTVDTGGSLGSLSLAMKGEVVK